MTTQLTRERTYSWTDPAETAAAALEVDGLTFLRGLAAGAVPPAPIATTLGMTLEEVDEGRVVFGLAPAEFHYNPIGSVHGGVYATVLDSACGCAVHSTLPAGARYTSLDLTVKFLRGLDVGVGPVRCEGRVLHSGRRTALAEARLTDASGRLYAHATSTCLVLLPIGGAMGIFSPVSARLSARFGARTTLLLGTSVLIVGNACMAFIPGTVVLVMVATTVTAIGAALAYSALPLLIMDAVPPTETAAANSLNTLMRMLGTSSCSAVAAVTVTALTQVVDGREIPSSAPRP